MRRLLRRSGVTPWDAGYAGISAREVKCAGRARPLTPDEIGWSTPPLPLPHARRRHLIASSLARAFLCGPWDQDGLVARGASVLNRRWRWLGPVVRRVLATFPAGKPLRSARLAEFLRRDPGFQRGCQNPKVALRPGIARPPLPVPAMSPVDGPPASWAVPAITTPQSLAARLGLDLSRLEWLADAQGRERTVRKEPLRHYRYRWIVKSSGSLRLIESPKPRLKQIQRRLLAEILAEIPPHEAAHGFRSGRSVTTFIAPHVGHHAVLKMDLRDFFPSITAAAVTAIFLTAGYPEDVARLLAGLCTNTAPIAITRDIERSFPRAVRKPGGRAGGSPSRTFRRELQPRQPWRTCAPTGSIAALTVWPAPRESVTHAMPTTWCSRETRYSLDLLIGSPFMSRRLVWRKDSRSSIARHESCGRGFASKRPASCSIGIPTSPAANTIGSRRFSTTAFAIVRQNKTAPEFQTSEPIFRVGSLTSFSSIPIAATGLKRIFEQIVW